MLSMQDFKDFHDQLVLELSEVFVWDGEAKRKSYLAPDAAWQYLNVVCPVLYPDDGHIYLHMSSIADVWRAWIRSYRAAQVKSNASLPGESPHFFGLSFDIDTGATRGSLTQAAIRCKKGLGSNADRLVVEYLVKCAPVGWAIGDSVNTIHVRALLKSLGFTPHRDIKRETWHYNIAAAGDSNGAVAVLARYPILNYKETSANNLILAQDMLQAILDPDTKLPLYNMKVDGKWGKGSKKAWERFKELYPAAFIRASGLLEKGRMLLGLPPGKRGMRILQTFTAKFKIVPPRQVF